MFLLIHAPSDSSNSPGRHTSCLLCVQGQAVEHVAQAAIRCEAALVIIRRILYVHSYMQYVDISNNIDV